MYLALAFLLFLWDCNPQLPRICPLNLGVGLVRHGEPLHLILYPLFITTSLIATPHAFFSIFSIPSTCCIYLNIRFPPPSVISLVLAFITWIITWILAPVVLLQCVCRIIQMPLSWIIHRTVDTVYRMSSAELSVQRGLGYLPVGYSIAEESRRNK